MSGPARTVCAEPGCPELATRAGRCREHGGKPWAGSHERRVELGVTDGPAGVAMRRAVRTRARNRCESCGAAVPPNAGVVDHRVPVGEGGSASDPVNLWLLCDDCDHVKTRGDLARMRARRGTGAPPPTRPPRPTPVGAAAPGAYDLEAGS